MESIFVNISLILGIAIAIAFVVRAFKQPLIISYILTGIICGPLFLNLINSKQEFFDLFAEFGVILLLFLVGVSLNVGFLRKIGKIAVVTGLGQAVFTSGIGFLIFFVLGFNIFSAVFLAISITFSSTIVITKLLSDKKETRSVYGRYTIGLMLVQDVIAILLMVFLPALQSGGSLWVALGFLLIKSAVFLAGVYLVAEILLPVILDKVAESGEFLLIFALAWCFTIAGAGEWAGLSLEVGAIIAGLSLAASKYQTEIVSRVKPLRDFFIALFFIILGSEMSFGNIQEFLLPSVVISLFVLLGNPLILYSLYRTLSFSRRNSFLAGLTAAQVSEFGFVFLFVSKDMGLVGNKELSIFTIVALITIFVSSYWITYNLEIFKKLEPILKKLGPDKKRQPEEFSESYEVVVFGYHRLGWKVCETLTELGVNFAVVDCDPRNVQKLKKRGIPYYFGDASEVDFLSELSFRKTKMVISTLPRAEDQFNLAKEVKKINSKTIFIANLSHTGPLREIYEAGADYVIIPHLMAGQWLSSILKEEKWTKTTLRKLRNKQKKELTLKFTAGG